MIALRHPSTGEVITVEYEAAVPFFPDFERVPAALAAVLPGLFDPGEHSAADVNTYLGDADPAEAERVIAAEQAGKARITITG